MVATLTFIIYILYNIPTYELQDTSLLCIVCVQCARVSCGVHAVEPDEQLRIDLVIVGGV